MGDGQRKQSQKETNHNWVNRSDLAGKFGKSRWKESKIVRKSCWKKISKLWPPNGRISTVFISELSVSNSEFFEILHIRLD
jgi:hypothetical protein